MSGKTNKYERQGFAVKRLDENKFVDCTEDYSKALEIIGDENKGELKRRDSNDSTKLLLQEDSRRIGGKLVRIGTPVEKTMTQSPSNNKADMMLLPGYSLQDQENDKKIQLEGVSRSALNVQDK